MAPYQEQGDKEVLDQEEGGCSHINRERLADNGPKSAGNIYWCSDCGAISISPEDGQVFRWHQPIQAEYSRSCTRDEDPIGHPSHYTQHPSGLECIQITEHMCFCLGNAIKYIWRADLKNDAIEDLKKARWYIDREINRRENK